MILKNILIKISLLFLFVPIFSSAEIIIDNNLNKAESTLLNTLGTLKGSKIININRNKIVIDNNLNYKEEKNKEDIQIKKYNVNYSEPTKETPKVNTY